MDYAIALALTVGLVFWLEWVHADLTNMFCFMDITVWETATEAVHQQNYNLAVKNDRLPLYPMASAVGLMQGMETLDSMQMVSRLSWATAVGILFLACARRCGKMAAFLALFILAWGQQFAQLTLWVNAQSFFNMLFAIYFCFGFQLAHSKKAIAWCALGALATIPALAKEQGFLLPPCALLYLLLYAPIKRKGWSTLLTRTVAFCVGALPLCMWLLNWVRAMWGAGYKFDQLRMDIEKLTASASWGTAMSQPLHWGRFHQTYANPENYLDLLSKAWPRLTMDIGYHAHVALLVVLASLFLAKTRQRSIDWKYLIWIGCSLLPMVPLFLVPLIEPYHLSFIEISAVAMMAWSAKHMFFGRLGRLSEFSLDTNRAAGICLYLLALGSIMQVGQFFPFAVKGQIGSCIAGRIRTVMEWTEQNIDSESDVWVANPMIRYNESNPSNYIAFSTLGELPPAPCSQPIAVVDSTFMSSWKERTIVAGVNDQDQSPVTKMLKDQKKWKQLHYLRGINDEKWYIYEPICP
jgi:hypothetical protein